MLKMMGMNILVKVEAQKEKTTAGGIIVPGTREEVLVKAQVLQVGSGGYPFSPEGHRGEFVAIEDVVPGDTVLIDRSYARELTVDGESCYLVLYRDIIAKEV